MHLRPQEALEGRPRRLGTWDWEETEESPGCKSSLHYYQILGLGRGFPGSSNIKNLPSVQVTPVRSLGREDPLEKGMVTHSSILAWRIPWTEEPDGLWSMGLQRVRHD